MSQFSTAEAITHAAEEHGVDPALVLTVLREAFTPHETMTAGERQFLMDAGSPADSFDREQQAEDRAWLASRSLAVQSATSRGLTTAEAARRLGGRATANVRRSAAAKDLYSYPRGPQRELVFPEWQFVDDKPLTGLRQVLGALPASMHPVALERWMTTPREELDHLSPVDWLAGGGDADVVVWLADSFARR